MRLLRCNIYICRKCDIKIITKYDAQSHRKSFHGKEDPGDLNSTPRNIKFWINFQGNERHETVLLTTIVPLI